MVHLFGQDFTRADLERLCPDVERLFGLEAYTVSDGPARGTRSLRLEAGAGLRVELLPDRLCDIGAVWCDDVPFHWAGPAGAARAGTAGTGTTLYGLMQTCGFDHIRQPETVEGVAYPLHGGMLHLPARLRSASVEWHGDDPCFVIRARATHHSLGGAVLDLDRRISIPWGKRSVDLRDRLRVRGAPIPVMAMYHANFGFPLAGEGASLALDGEDLTGVTLAGDGIATHPVEPGPKTARLTGPTGSTVEMTFDGAHFPVFQVLRDYRAGTNLICLEPASHHRRPRHVLLEEGALTPAAPGEVLTFGTRFRFDP